MYLKCTIDSPVGPLTAVCSGEAITGLWFQGSRFFMQGVPGDVQEASTPVFDALKRWLDRYFSGENPEINFTLAPEGTDFRLAVCQALREIPYGETTSYGAIAALLTERLGHRVSARAVGGAVGHNPISILIPCHRVIGADGSMTGFGGGLNRKIFLLKLENAL